MNYDCVFERIATFYVQNIFFFRDERDKIKVPKDMDDAKALGTVLSKYKDTYYTQVLIAYFATYILYPLHQIRQVYRVTNLPLVEA